MAVDGPSDGAIRQGEPPYLSLPAHEASNKHSSTQPQKKCTSTLWSVIGAYVIGALAVGTCLLAATVFIHVSAKPTRPKKWEQCDKDNRPPYSSSIAEAKHHGTLISEVEIIPNIWNFAGKEITFSAAWLEQMPDGYYAPFALCLRIDQGREVFGGLSGPFIYSGEKGHGFESLANRERLLFVQLLDSEDLTHLRASLVKDGDKERQKNIRFVRKDKLPDRKVGRK